MIRIFLSVLVMLSVELLSAQHVASVDAVGITVSDMDKALHFYTKVLSFEKVGEVEVYGDEFEKLKGLFGIHYRKVRLKLGLEEIELTDYLTPGGRPVPLDSKSNDLWFQHIAIVVSNMDSAYARLRRHNIIHVSTRPQTLPESIPPAAGVKAFYFQDPDAHNLELIYFPRGKGNPKWQLNHEEIFLGIDHTAIGISQTERSRKFYGSLGIRYQGESFNYGKEQEHLNNVMGARLHITGNKAERGMGVEFLEYLTPKTGRPYPADARSDDLLHWETIIIVENIEELYDKFKSDLNIISSGIVSLPRESYGYKRGLYFRDPDGHVLGIFEK